MESYSKLSTEELVEEYERTTKTLSGQITELGLIKVQRAWLFDQGYMNNAETTVSGRERAGDHAALSVTEDMIRLEANIESGRVLSAFLSDLLSHRAG